MGPATTATTTAAATREPRRTTDKRYECERPTVERIRKFFRKNYTGTDGEDSSGTETAHRKKNGLISGSEILFDGLYFEILLIFMRQML